MTPPHINSQDNLQETRDSSSKERQQGAHARIPFEHAHRRDGKDTGE
jgi:hypothetical protein